MKLPMPEQEIRHALPETLPHKTAQGAHVGDEDVFALARRHVAEFGGIGRAFAVADVVLAAYGEPVAREEARELVVAPHMLAHAVDDLYDGARRDGRSVRCGGRPQARADGRRAVLGRIAESGFGDPALHETP